MKEKKTEEIKKEGEPLDAEKWENSRLDWKRLENTQLGIIVCFWYVFFPHKNDLKKSVNVQILFFSKV